MLRVRAREERLLRVVLDSAPHASPPPPPWPGATRSKVGRPRAPRVEADRPATAVAFQARARWPRSSPTTPPKPPSRSIGRPPSTVGSTPCNRQRSPTRTGSRSAPPSSRRTPTGPPRLSRALFRLSRQPRKFILEVYDRDHNRLQSQSGALAPPPGADHASYAIPLASLPALRVRDQLLIRVAGHQACFPYLLQIRLDAPRPKRRGRAKRPGRRRDPAALRSPDCTRSYGRGADQDPSLLELVPAGAPPPLTRPRTRTRPDPRAPPNPPPDPSVRPRPEPEPDQPPQPEPAPDHSPTDRDAPHRGHRRRLRHLARHPR